MAFLFVACQSGAEKALKAELAREHSGLKFAFSRPGFVTFKGDEESFGRFELDSVFARAYGESLVTLKQAASGAGAQGVLEAARGLKERVKLSAPLRLHVFERDQHPPGEEPQGFRPGVLADQALRMIRAEDREGLFAAESQATVPGELVLDVIVVDENEWWVGWHEHSSRHHGSPGGNPRIALPKEAPSRAYLKLEEALLWSRAPIKKGDRAVEIGSAPGGACFALLERGLEVFGIDPGEMDPVVLRNPRYRHLSKSVMFVEEDELPSKVDWLLTDMNAEPSVALYAVERIAGMCPGLSGVLLTIKLNEWSLAEHIPEYLDRLRKNLGLSRIRATQLAHNRREICVYGLTRKGMAR
ncbi:MAG: hypothetical protein P4M08_13385 [Oligoflexia bacterium]|nr:hypothetical protein [Oligoflexia bacterium]